MCSKEDTHVLGIFYCWHALVVANKNKIGHPSGRYRYKSKKTEDSIASCTDLTRN